MTQEKDSSGTETLSKEKTTVDRPKLFKVVLLNDDYTSMDFVVSILESIFKKGPAEAVQIMLQVHNNGRGVCGVYPRQIAEAKVQLVHARAQADGFPLRCVMEES
jgi:ATP-dependent Clp protease adaptor protein ClpS